MAKVIEPPVLLSRTLTFILAASVAVLVVLLFTLYKMPPLTRPEVFFLRYQSRNINYVLGQPNPRNTHFKKEYIDGFIRAYIIARNSLELPKTITIENWNRIVKPWSSKSVYKTFTETDEYKDVMAGWTQGITCSVRFNNTEIIEPVAKYYPVAFEKICYDENSGRQISKKSYKIKIVLESYLKEEANNVLDYLEKLRDNPLGLEITEYKIIEEKDSLSDTEKVFIQGRNVNDDLL